MFVGLLIESIIIFDIIYGCIQSYKKRKAEKRAEKYMENGNECGDIARIPTGERVLNEESQLILPHQTNQSPNEHKTFKHFESSNVQNNNPEKNENHFKIRK